MFVCYAVNDEADEVRRGEARPDEGPSLLASLTKAKHVASLIHECWQCRLALPHGEASGWLLWLARHEVSETR